VLSNHKSFAVGFAGALPVDVKNLYVVKEDVNANELDPRIEPVNDVAVTDPETLVLPETISPFLAINSFAIYPLFHYPKVKLYKL
jgi:hypothetical protein